VEALLGKKTFQPQMDTVCKPDSDAYKIA
jgi:hypothetical protein